MPGNRPNICTRVGRSACRVTPIHRVMNSVLALYLVAALAGHRVYAQSASGQPTETEQITPIRQVTEADLTASYWCAAMPSGRVFRWDFSTNGFFSMRRYPAKGTGDRYPVGAFFQGSWTLSGRIDQTDEKIIATTEGAHSNAPRNYLVHLEEDHMIMKVLNKPGVSDMMAAVRCSPDSTPEYDSLPPPTRY
jgi:hypothetical protein